MRVDLLGGIEHTRHISDAVARIDSAVNVLRVDVDKIESACDNAVSFSSDGGQHEKVQIANTLASVESTVDTFENEVEKYVENRTSCHRIGHVLVGRFLGLWRFGLW